MTEADGRDGSETGTTPDVASGGTDDLAEAPAATRADTAGSDTSGRHAPEQANAPRPVRRLSLGDPVARVAAEDRPESWGERGDSDSDRVAYYRAQRPPHHGG